MLSYPCPSFSGLNKASAVYQELTRVIVPLFPAHVKRSRHQYQCTDTHVLFFVNLTQFSQFFGLRLNEESIDPHALRCWVGIHLLLLKIQTTEIDYTTRQLSKQPSFPTGTLGPSSNPPPLHGQSTRCLVNLRINLIPTVEDRPQDEFLCAKKGQNNPSVMGLVSPPT